MTARRAGDAAGRPRWAELAIAGLVIAVVAMLIVPLPRPLLDALFALNLAIAVVLLMAAVLTPRPLGFGSFPTLLVVTTLLRVGLEVSATRLILADADAGAVVRAFGAEVASGSLVVGLVVFAVITVVQLLVVARGAERVAEVAARFALDAMPGKQLAIDAEVRAGALDAEAARARRGALERESQLYGAMDGAMRFVKGDAVAALVIVAVNLIGGMAIGVGARGMSAAEAARTYSLLSIGSGLLAQIPSLLVAVAAGLLVTRVASTGDRALGEDLGEQLGADPRALGGAALLLAVLALVPGLPLAPFLLLAVAAGAAALAAARRRPRPAPALDEPGAAAARGPRLALRLPPAAYAQLAARPGELHARLAAARARAAEASGVPVPPLAVEADPALGEREAALAIEGTPAAWLELVQGAGGSAAPGAGELLAAIDARLDAALRPLLPELLGVDRVAAMVERMAQAAPALAREVVPRIVSLPVLAEVLRGLVREELPVSDLAAVLEAIALAPAPAGGHTAQGAPALIEHLRGRLRRQIAARWAPRGRLAVYTVDAMIEDAVRGAIDRSDGAAVLALEPAIAQDIVAAVRGKLGAGPAVILTSGDVRPHLRGLLEPELPAIAVLAAHELAPGVAIEAAGRIEVAEVA